MTLLHLVTAKVAVPIAEGEFTGIVNITREATTREEAIAEVVSALEELGRWVEDISLREVVGATEAEIGF